MRLLPSLWSSLPPKQGHSDPFAAWNEDIGRMFVRFGQGLPPAFSGADLGVLAPHIDIAETDDEVTVTAELPGVAEDDLSISLLNDVLTLAGEKKSEEVKEGDSRKYRLVERSYGSFHRSIPLPFHADPASVNASFENGVLTVKVPKPANAQPAASRIPIGKPQA